MVRCPVCDNELIEAITNFDVFIQGVKVGVLKDTTVYTCSNCNYDGLFLPIEIDIDGLHIGEEKGD